MEPHEEAAAGLVGKIKENIFNPLVALLFAVAFLVFMWGAYQFVANADSDQARESGKRHMMYGIVGLLVMISAYGILSIALRTFGIDVPQK